MRRLAVALIISAAGSLSLTAAPALALHTHLFATTFAGSGTDALANPSWAAVDNSTGPSAGDVYVTDTGHNRIEKFDSTGKFILMFGKGVDETKVNTSGSTEAEQNVCTVASGDTCKAGTPGSTPGAFTTAQFIAVDSSSGEVYVGYTGDGTVSKFDESGNLSAWGKKGQITGFGGLSGIAVDPKGYLFVETGNISWYEPNGTPHNPPAFNYPRGTSPNGLAVDAEDHLYKIDGSPNVTKFTVLDEDLANTLDGGSASGLAIDPFNNDLYVDESGAFISHFALNCGEGCIPLDSFGNGQLNGAQGLGIAEKSHTVYVANTGGGNVAVFDAVIIPDVTTGTISELTPKSATAAGELNPAEGGNVTTCAIEYATETFFNAHGYTGAQTAECSPAPPYSEKKEVKAKLVGLTASTTYHYRIAAGNAQGTNYGQDHTFTTPEAVAFVTTLPATGIEKGGAILNGSYQGEGLDTTYHFEYGLENCATSACTSIPIPDADNGTGKGIQKVSAHIIEKLKGGTTYHYRLVATNPEGTGVGQDETVTTSPAVTELKTEAATELIPTGAALNGSFFGDGLETKYFFEYGVEAGVYGQTTETFNAGSPSGLTKVKPATIGGLLGHHFYHFRIVATNSFGTTYGQDEELLTPARPTIGGVSSSKVTANSAVLNAKLNPESAATKCHFEYGPTPSYGTVVPCTGPPLTGFTEQAVKVELTGLKTVTYHFRFVAENLYGTATSEDVTFNFYPETCPNEHRRQETHSTALPDCRAYELVSPSKQGSFIVFPGSAPPTSYATNPSRFSFGGGFGSLPGTDPPTGFQIDNYVSTRTNNGWVTKYAGVSGEDTLAASNMVGDLGFDKVIDFNTPNSCFGCVHEPEPVAPYVWAASGESLGRWPTNVEPVPGADFNSKGTWQTSPDFSHLAYSSNNVEWAPGGLTKAPGSAYDYNTASGTTKIISLTPSGENIPQEPGRTEVNEWINFPGDNVYSYEHIGEPTQIHPSVSTDGSHILMSTIGASSGVHLYMRVNDEVTYDVSQQHDVNYLGMTADGSKVFFTSNEDLTNEDTRKSTDLYMWSEATNSLKVISLGNNGSGNSDACEPVGGWTNGCSIVPVEPAAKYTGDSPIASASGDIYFYSPEQLDGSKGLPNEENLYVYRGGQVHYVTTFEPGGYCTPNESGCSNGPVGRINVSPDGNHMAFITTQRLSGYQNNGFAEMYDYEPSTERLFCVSCDPSGAPPVGGTSGSDDGLFMADDGRTFFYTPDALVPQDTNELHDVYEYVGGRPQLITAGTGSLDEVVTNNQERTVGLAGVSADGVDVYFSTFDVLVGQDENGQFAKYYDARTNGGFPAPPAALPCAAADECHGVGSSPPGAPKLGSTADIGSGGNWPANTPSSHGKKHHKKRHKRHASRRHR